MATSPRDIAVEALGDRDGNVSAHLDRLLAEGGLSAPDKALARELALGAVRRRTTLHEVLRAFLERPNHRLPGAVESILHVALYQMLFLERVPVFAAVNEAVEQAGRFGHRRKAGLVNGTLRAAAREISPAENGRPPQAADVVPVDHRTFRRLARAVFPAPSADPAGYLAAAMSLPRPLCERWIKRLGSFDAAARLAVQCNARAPLILRVNRLKCDIAAAAAALAAEGVETVPHANGRSLVATDWASVRDLKAFREGMIQPQDPTATAVVEAANPERRISVLDFCAAPGTKTTHLAEAMRNDGRIVAVDVSRERLAKVESNCLRMGATIVKTLLAEQVGGLEPGSFDLALVDVPCSNTGVLARRPEARWRFDERDLQSLAADQRRLLLIAAQFVRAGGRLVYSTCSIEPEEDQEIARWATRAGGHGPGLKLLREELTLPGGTEDHCQWRDGGYFAVFRVG